LIIFLLVPGLAWCWGDEGHQTVARIAAAHLSAQARQAVLALLSQDSDFAAGGADVAALMAAAAIWPDHMPGGKGATAPWHYIDIGLFEGPPHIAERCVNGDCIVTKMNQYLVNLKQHRADGSWQESKELAFLLHFAGDIHQPLHCVTNADAGGNCVNVIGFEGIRNLHATWDTTLVRNLMSEDGAGMLDAMESRYRGQRRHWENYSAIENIAAESWGLAKSKVYGKTKPRVPVIDTFIEVQPSHCDTEAPARLRQIKVDGPHSFGEASLKVVRGQLYKGGVRLAAMLNAIYGG
jgi:hypothetical protein